ncbi:hypothetical protein ElyMa_000853700 [Elysia marginata]|uniref:Transferrin-like domain-containing protein n=1 Tax=Elysia marginata TaxID=1093978 RepID=A0AAV4H2L2_9GAST|nr:hypothetical protein ElyMa_000853700 [Elysia marginata]
MDGWVDACTGYGNTLDRESAFDFTYAYLRSTSYYSVAPGNPSGFRPNETDFSKYTFTHLTGAYTNAKCLSRQGKKVGKIVIAANLPEAKALLFNKTADVLFSPRSRIPGLVSLPEEVHCARTGVSIMVKRGSSLPGWWNPAFRSYVESGQFARFCRDSRIKYRYAIDCLADDVILGFS